MKPVEPPPDLAGLVLESIGEAVFAVDRDWHITFYNRAAERLTGISREEALGMRCADVFRTEACQGACPLARSIETGEPQHDVRLTVLDRDMEEVPVSVTAAPLLRDGELVGGVEILRDLSELEDLRRALGSERGFADIVGQSPPMRELFRILPDVARSDAPVLIEGPSGSGKELVAQAIHRLSERRAGPFVPINCGALPDSLLESELFGHRKGAFTGATRDHLGRFQAADGGTLFLDEIGETSPAFQVKLLRVLQEGRVQPLGSDRSVPVDVRVISATHRDLARMVAEGRFREDLYYRLRVFPIRLPPLKDRREDIPLLARHLLRRLALRRNRPVVELSPEALAALQAYDYPGNVRELENLLERALVLCRGPRIELAHLPPELLGEGRPAARPEPGRPPEEPRTASATEEEPEDGTAETGDAPPASQEEDERARILAALRAHRWRRAETARALGIGRTTLWRKMKRYGLL